MWFNQVPAAPLADGKKAWFRSREFRLAVSRAINRGDLCRMVYRGRAVPAAGPVSSANRFWFNQSLKPHAFDPQEALRLLAQAGFRMQSGVLSDQSGTPVEFSLITNAGNKQRERMAAMIQQDLRRIGIRVNVVTLDFPSLIERITRTWNYEACLLGLVNIDLDPNAQMNVWLSSGASHQWNPSQPAPATAWEAEIDRLMRAQASALDNAKRKAAFDQVQRIVWEQAPFLYLVNRNALAAAAPAVGNLQVSRLHPQTFWNADQLYLAGQPRANR
jgi:peptide/nickel transport system substrate-binding protein